MRWTYLVLLAAFANGASALAQDKPPIGPVRCEKEADCLRRLGGLASRDGNWLRLKLENGATKSFKSDPNGCDDGTEGACLTHELTAYLPSVGIYVVTLFYWEGRGAEVVNSRTGETLTLDGVPHFSPSGRRFAFLNHHDVNAASHDMAIWSVSPGRWRQEFRDSRANNHDGWEIVGWDGEDRIRIALGLEDKAQQIEGDAVRTEQGWKLRRPVELLLRTRRVEP